MPWGGENPRESLSELAKLGARLIIQRGHFSAYTDQLERASQAATAWFVEHLRPAARAAEAVATRQGR